LTIPATVASAERLQEA